MPLETRERALFFLLLLLLLLSPLPQRETGEKRRKGTSNRNEEVVPFLFLREI